MPFDARRYPANWRGIRDAIGRRAGRRCEWCHVENGALLFPRCCSNPQHDETATPPQCRTCHKPLQRVVLTVAHLGVTREDGTPGDKADTMDCRFENLAALCQRCHLRLDQDDHIRHARESRLARVNAGQLTLCWEEEP